MTGSRIFAAFAIATTALSQSCTPLTDLGKISKHWGQLTPYSDNPDHYFGVNDIGLPDGCQIEQAHTLQRHADRFPTAFFDDGLNDESFAQKVQNFTTSTKTKLFTGQLAFLNTYEYMVGESYLTGLGASSEFAAGVTFWNRYGRSLYGASKGQLAYNPSSANGTARPKPVLRTTGQSRIENSQINWSLGFFGTTFQITPDPELKAFTNGSLFDVVVVPEGGTENNTLASYDSCFADDVGVTGELGDLTLLNYIPLYLSKATARLQKYCPSGFVLSNNDTYAMQSICAYESSYIGTSDFCTLFTEDEWAGFEQTLDIEYYFDYAWGNPTGRAQGLGYLQELLARLQDQYIISSNSSVNSTITSNPALFPLRRPFYADFSHDDIIISTLTAMSMDYFRAPPNLTQFPPNPNRHFVLSRLTPFAANLVTEVIGCSSANPTAVPDRRTSYYQTQYGYNAADATHKFIRMRLNNGILPLDSIRGHACLGRSDGLCPLHHFIESQQQAMQLANYDYACFGNYSVMAPTGGTDFDGTVTAASKGIRHHEGTLNATNI